MEHENHIIDRKKNEKELFRRKKSLIINIEKKEISNYCNTSATFDITPKTEPSSSPIPLSLPIHLNEVSVPTDQDIHGCKNDLKRNMFFCSSNNSLNDLKSIKLEKSFSFSSLPSSSFSSSLKQNEHSHTDSLYWLQNQCHNCLKLGVETSKSPKEFKREGGLCKNCFCKHCKKIIRYKKSSPIICFHWSYCNCNEQK